MNDKPSLFLLLPSLFLLMAACKTSAPETEPAVQTESAVEAAIVMTPEQMEMAGVELGKPIKRVISSHIECTGRVEVPPESLASVYAPVSGFIQSVQHLPGDFVRKGTLLTSIRHPDLIKLQREFLEVKTQIPYLEQDYERKKVLAESETASAKALQQTKSELDMARVKLKGLKAELDLIGIATKKLEDEQEIQTTLSLYAPVSGYITKVEVNLGKLVNPSDLLFEIIDQQHLHLELQVFAKDINWISEGQLIVCNMPGSDQSYSGSVHLVGKMIDSETKTAMVHGHFDEQPMNITAGAYLQARIFTRGEDVLALPNEALIRTGSETYVFIHSPAGFEKRLVQIGRNDDQYTEIKALDLDEGNLVAIAGAYYINGSETGE